MDDDTPPADPLDAAPPDAAPPDAAPRDPAPPGPLALSDWPDLGIDRASLADVFLFLTRAAGTTNTEHECYGAVEICERIIRYASARQTAFLAEACRHAHQELAPAHIIPATQAVSAEFAPLFALSKARAEQTVIQAQNLATDHPGLLRLVRDGHLDLYRATLINDLMRDTLQPGTSAWNKVTDAITKIAPGATVARIRRKLRQLLDTADPQAAARRHAKAKARRSVKMYPLPDGMGLITATLSAADAMHVDVVLDVLADACRDHAHATGKPDPRTHQQRRTDAFTSIFNAISAGTALPLVPNPAPSTAPREDNEPRNDDAPGKGTPPDEDAAPRQATPDAGNERSGDSPRAGDSPPSRNHASDESDSSLLRDATAEDGGAPFRADSSPEERAPRETDAPPQDDASPRGERQGDTDSHGVSRDDVRPPDVADGKYPGSPVAERHDGGQPGQDNGQAAQDSNHPAGDGAFFAGGILPPGAGYAPKADGSNSSAAVLGWWMPPALPKQQGRRPHLRLTMSSSTFAGLDDLPGDLHGYGPVTADLARQIASQAGKVTCIVLSDGDHACEHSAMSESDITTPEADTASRPNCDAGPDTVSGRDATPGQDATPTRDATPEASRNTVESGLRVPAGPSRRAIETAAPETTPPEQPEPQPHDLDDPRVWSFAGHGPGDQDNCPNGDRAYRPYQTLRDRILGLFPTCTFPGCSRPAEQCDLDHLTPYERGGVTCICNIAPACRFHHRLKTIGGWHARFTTPGEPHPTGTVEWISRVGQRFVVTPPVLPGANGWQPWVSTGHAPTGAPTEGTESTDRREGLEAALEAARAEVRDPRDATPEERRFIRERRWRAGLARLARQGKIDGSALPNVGCPADPGDRAAGPRERASGPDNTGSSPDSTGSRPGGTGSDCSGRSSAAGPRAGERECECGPDCECHAPPF